jgi:hypothetical protein
MTLAKARVEANGFFKDARLEVRSGRRSTRSAAEILIAVFWQLSRQLGGRDKTLFQNWFDKKHDALGKELRAK